jgi:hypothetical protein
MADYCSILLRQLEAKYRFYGGGAASWGQDPLELAVALAPTTTPTTATMVKNHHFL